MLIIILAVYAAFMTGLFLCAYVKAANTSEERITEQEYNRLVVKELLVQNKRAQQRIAELEHPLQTLTVDNGKLSQAVVKTDKSKLEKLLRDKPQIGRDYGPFSHTPYSARPTRAEREKERQAIMEQKRLVRFEKNHKEYVERMLKEQMEKREPLAELLDKSFGEPIRKIDEPTGCDEEDHPSSMKMEDMLGPLGMGKPACTGACLKRRSSHNHPHPHPVRQHSQLTTHNYQLTTAAPPPMEATHAKN